MIEAYALAAVALIGTGAVIGFLALVSLGIRREEAAHSVTTPTSDKVAHGARAASGMYARIPGSSGRSGFTSRASCRWQVKK
jgi:hypothetical protein